MGMTVGTHSCTHSALNRMSDAEALGELQDSKKWLEDEVSHEVVVMSFPFGAAGNRGTERAILVSIWRQVSGASIALHKVNILSRILLENRLFYTHPRTRYMAQPSTS